jgi:oxalate decarboxylase/phosphoglucose isomerase-like protein (cupin superfamily)
MTMVKRAAVRWIQFRQYAHNGVLSVFAGDDPDAVPFPIARVFTIVDVSAGGERGNHAHRKCSQLLVVLKGTARVLINDSADTVSHSLKPDGKGLLVPPGLWNTVVFESAQTVVMVICDEAYDPGDYIFDWNEYLLMRRP